MVRESFDIHFIIEKFPAILSALPVSLEITAVTLVLGWLLLALALTAVMALLLPYSLPWLALLGGSLPCFTAARVTLTVIDDLIVKE